VGIYKEWSFQAGEGVAFWWMRSPRLDPVNRLWIATAIFRRLSGECQEIEFPWREFWRAHQGWIYRDGRINTELEDLAQFGIQRRRIDLAEASTPILLSAREALGAGHKLIQGAKNLSEFCIKFRIRNLVLVIPVLALIQSLTPSIYLAFGILEPNYPERILMGWEVEKDTLYLNFSNEVPHSSLTKPFVKTIAELLYDTSFRRIWGSVYRNRLLDLASHRFLSWEDEIPLKIEFPECSAIFVWGVCYRLIEFTNGALYTEGFLVHEISLKRKIVFLPFIQIEVRHPNLNGVRIYKY
jgi:hypothetical protein